MSGYAKKTGHRTHEDRSLSVRAVHREQVDMNKLAEALIRLTLQETGPARATARASSHPQPYSPDRTSPVAVAAAPVE